MKIVNCEETTETRSLRTGLKEREFIVTVAREVVSEVEVVAKQVSKTRWEIEVAGGCSPALQAFVINYINDLLSKNGPVKLVDEDYFEN